MRTLTFLLVATAVSLGSSGCAGMTPRIYTPLQGENGAAERGDHAREIEMVAMELADRAESRSPLGNARIRVGPLDAIEPRRSPYRQVSILERDLRATEATLRHELGMSLANRVNIVGDGAEIATHRIEGEFLRAASALEISLRLVEIKSDWIVATARRRIENFVPEFYDRRLQPKDPQESVPLESAVAKSTPRGRTRALRPAYPAPRIEARTDTPLATRVEPELPSEVAAAEVVPEPTAVLSAVERPSGSEHEERGRKDDGAPIRFESGPAAARLRAGGALPAAEELAPPGSPEH